MKSINPFNNQLIDEYKEESQEALIDKVDRSFECWQEWKKTSFHYRADLLRKCAEILRQNREEYATLITLEMGKLIGESLGEIDKCAWVCEYYADNSENILKNDKRESDAAEGSYVVFDSLGPVLAVMPWNFPFWQVFRFAAPALMAGNTGLLKHASNVSGCALAIEKIFAEAGFPADCFITLLAKGSSMETVIASDKVRGVTLTGSEGAGKAVASAAGKYLKKSVLELGGSDPFIVCEDADLNKAVEAAVAGRMLNCGQSCIAAKRFIVHESLEEEFLRGVTGKMETFCPGDPLDKETGLAPLARQDICDELTDQLKRGLDSGDELIFEGKKGDYNGVFFSPVIVKCNSPESPLFKEETFGPVMAVYSFCSEEEAVKLSNSSPYGLGASVWSRDRKRAANIARQIESGAVFVNSITKSDPRLPFGGVKLSGYGRELSDYGIREFVNIKTLWVD